jgi:hypothetical protein
MDIAAASVDCRPAIASPADIEELPIFLRLLHNPLIGSIAPALAEPRILARVQRLANNRSAARPQNRNHRYQFHHAVLIGPDCSKKMPTESSPACRELAVCSDLMERARLEPCVG